MPFCIPGKVYTFGRTGHKCSYSSIFSFPSDKKINCPIKRHPAIVCPLRPPATIEHCPRFLSPGSVGQEVVLPALGFLLGGGKSRLESLPGRASGHVGRKRGQFAFREISRAALFNIKKRKKKLIIPMTIFFSCLILIEKYTFQLSLLFLW